MRKQTIQKKLMILPWYYNPVAHIDEACGKPFAGETAESISQVFQKSQQDSEATWNNCLQLSIPNNQFTNAVFFFYGLGYLWETS